MANQQEDLRRIGGLSEEKYAWYMLGLAVARLVAETRAHGTEEDRAFCRDLSQRLYDQCAGNPERIAHFRHWIEQGFI
jgi:hypothetical protein